MSPRLSDFIRRWFMPSSRAVSTCRSGNVTILFAIVATMVIIAAGMGIDLWQAYVVNARLQAALDSAALAIATTSQGQYTQAQLQQRAQAFVTANYPTTALGTASTPTLTVTNNNSVVNVNATASVATAFMSIVGINKLTVGAVSQVTIANPNIDFYLLLDSSPSMAIAATPAGITKMVNATPQQGGCAFGCHQTNPGKDNLGNPGGIDNYQLARNLGVTLRIDMLRQAAQDLMTTAQQTMASNSAAYRAAIYTFDVQFNTIQNLTTDLTGARTAASNIKLLQVYANNWLTSSNNNSDTDTNYDLAMNGINAIMPNPGGGTNAAGDTPQEVLFIVTDGVEDEKVASCPQPNPNSASVICNGSRQQSVMDPGWCTTIKNRGIRIAVLYTTYLPLPTNSWYNTYISPFQSKIGSTLQSCASPQLYFEVQSGQDISAALTALFQQAVNTAYLSR
jgi:Flp pilus assembly protein TadG